MNYGWIFLDGKFWILEIGSNGDGCGGVFLCGFFGLRVVWFCPACDVMGDNSICDYVLPVR